MPFSPSDLPWWGWLLCSIGAFSVCFLAVVFADSSQPSARRSLIIVVLFGSGLAGLASGILGLVLFVKWILE